MSLKTRSVIILTLILLAITNTQAPAAEPETPPASAFDKGTWAFQLNGGYMNELGGEDQEIWYSTAQVGYYFQRDFSINAEIGGWNINQPGDDAAAVVGGLSLRTHFYHFDRGTVFIDVGESLFQADNPVPESGTSFNYVFQTGFGMSCELWDKTHFVGGIRYYHLSNAGRDGDDKNPSNNGIQGYLGVMWTF